VLNIAYELVFIGGARTRVTKVVGNEAGIGADNVARNFPIHQLPPSTVCTISLRSNWVVQTAVVKRLLELLVDDGGQLGKAAMHTLYVLIIYIIHNGRISDGTLFPVVELYASAQECSQSLKTLHYGARQKAICAPITGIQGNQVLSVEHQIRQCAEVAKSVPGDSCSTDSSKWPWPCQVMSGVTCDTLGIVPRDP
jgi:hypothetical protein